MTYRALTFFFPQWYYIPIILGFVKAKEHTARELMLHELRHKNVINDIRYIKFINLMYGSSHSTKIITPLSINIANINADIHRLKKIYHIQLRNSQKNILHR